MHQLRKKPGTMCAEILVGELVVGEVEFKNYGVAEGWRWRDFKGDWGDAADQEAAIKEVLERYIATRR